MEHTGHCIENSYLVDSRILENFYKKNKPFARIFFDVRWG